MNGLLPGRTLDLKTMSASSAPLKRTPFYDLHVAAGAKIVPFAGFEMPIQYPTGITAEHQAVRNACGVFDVSHMGEFIIRGPQAIDFVTYVTSNDVSALGIGQVHYSAILTEQGTFVDDCLVYRYADHLMMSSMARTRTKTLRTFNSMCRASTAPSPMSRMRSASSPCRAPKAESILQQLTPADLAAIKYYWFVETTVAGIPMTLSRTGYTGEDGFELYHDVTHSAALWKALMETGAITPAGLGCRDSLRLEMGMALYGNDIDDTITPLEAGLGWLVKLKKGDFVGRAALEAQKAAGVPRKLVGFTFTEKAIPRHGYPVFVNGAPSGVVMSGIMSPSVGVGWAPPMSRPITRSRGTCSRSRSAGSASSGTITPSPSGPRGR